MIHILTEELIIGTKLNHSEDVDVLRNYGTMDRRIPDDIPVDAGFPEESKIWDGGRDTSQQSMM
jgi:hypothetical protein